MISLRLLKGASSVRWDDVWVRWDDGEGSWDPKPAIAKGDHRLWIGSICAR
jgi:hypothetical protein